MAKEEEIVIGKKEPENIDDTFRNYILNHPTPNNDKDWLDYIEFMWANAIGTGIGFTLKSMTEEFEKSIKEKE